MKSTSRSASSRRSGPRSCTDPKREMAGGAFRALVEYKQVLVVREDLDISEGKRAVQVAHGAVGAALEARERHTKWYKEWLREGQRKVVVRTRDLAELRALHERAKSMNLPCILIEDAGLTEVPPGTTTCLGIGPAPEALVDQVTGRLPLW